jgi:threonine dehydrogenase-like Zn-dependent dehydrogenase
VRLANICGSDLHFWHGHGPRINPDIAQVLGHEMMGVVYALGRNVKTDSLGRPLKEGDRICYSYFRNCGACWSCLSGTAACQYRYRDWIGVSADLHPHFRGAFGEYYYMHPGHWVFKVPDELPDEMVAAVNCAVSEVLYGLHKVGVTLGDTVVIQGAGGLGLYAIAVAREMGAGCVISLDRVEERLALAREMGADHTLNVEATEWEERVTRVREWSGGNGADVVVEVAGDPDCVQEGVDMMRPGGRYLWIGNINLGFTTLIDPASLVRTCKTVTAIIVYEGWVIPRALDFLVRTRGRYPYHKVISHRFKLTEINRALELSAARKVIRATLEA